MKALNFDGSGEGEESIRRISVKTQYFGDGEEICHTNLGDNDGNWKRNIDAKKINSVGRRTMKGK